MNNKIYWCYKLAIFLKLLLLPRYYIASLWVKKKKKEKRVNSIDT